MSSDRPSARSQAAAPLGRGAADDLGIAGHVRVAWPVALLGALAALLGRGIAPALVGVWVGVDDVVTAIQFAAAMAAQLFAIVAVGLTVGLAIALSRSGWPVVHRAFAVGVVGLVTMAVASAVFIRLPEVSGVAAGAAVGLLAVLIGVYAAGVASSRAAALVVAGVGLGGLVRAGAIALSYLGPTEGSVVSDLVASVTATLAFVLHLATILVALGYLAWRRGHALQWLAAGVLIALATLIVWLGVAGSHPDAAGAAVLVSRAIGLLLTAPPPLVPAIVEGSAHVLAWLLAVALLFRRGSPPMMPTAICLALVALGGTEAPAGSLGLALAALLVAVGTPRGRLQPTQAGAGR